MVENTVYILNGIASIFTASLLNTAFITCAGVAIAALIARSKRWSAASRYSLWWLMVALVVIAPIASALIPAKPTPVHHYSYASEALRNVSNIEKAVPMAQPVLRPSPMAILLLGWSAAACFQLIVLLRGLFYGLRLKRTSEGSSECLETLFNRLARQSSLRRPATLAMSRHLSVPAVIGYFQPRVLIPTDLEARLSITELEQVLLHELAHISRRDDWTIAAQRLIEAVGVLHPLLRYLGYRLSRDREMACDDLVAAVHEPQRYAACLAKVADIGLFTPVTAVLVPLLERKSELLARVEMLLDKTRTHAPQVSAYRLLLASVGCVALGIAGLRVPKLMASPVAEHFVISPLPAVPAVPAEPAVSAQIQNVAPNKSDSSIHSIVITSENGHSSMFGSWSGSSDDDRNYEPGTIEFRLAGKAYVIRDKAILAKAQEILKPEEELGEKQSVLGEQQAKLGEQQAKLGEEQAKIAERQMDAATSSNLSRRLAELRAKVDELNARALAKTVSDAQAQLAELQSRLGEMQAEMGEEQGKSGQEQGHLGEAQSELGRKQAELGKRQAELGNQQAIESKKAMEKLDDLIRNSRSLAQPVH